MKGTMTNCKYCGLSMYILKDAGCPARDRIAPCMPEPLSATVEHIVRGLGELKQSYSGMKIDAELLQRMTSKLLALVNDAEGMSGERLRGPASRIHAEQDKVNPTVVHFILPGRLMLFCSLREAAFHPQFAHDCERCVFLGRTEEHDFYCCQRQLHVMGGTVIARFGSKGPEYKSGFAAAEYDGDLRFALNLACEEGLHPWPDLPG